MSPARWPRLPEKGVTAPRARRATVPGVWRCAGLNGCGTVLRCSYAKAQKHADECGSHRLEIMQEDS